MTISNPCQGCPHLSHLYLPSLQWKASDLTGISNEKKYLDKIITLENKLKIAEEALIQNINATNFILGGYPRMGEGEGKRRQYDVWVELKSSGDTSTYALAKIREE